jgi:N-acetylneuraminate synthase
VDITQNPVPLVSSFANISGRRNFIQEVKDLIVEFAQDGVDLMPQWLPPFAWYFGGSVALHSFNSFEEIDQLVQLNMPLCLDTSHLIMSANFEGLPVSVYTEKLVGITKHLHISGAHGIDGEGISLGMLENDVKGSLVPLLDLPIRKVLEVWQGHIDHYRRFSLEFNELLKWIDPR